jgi:hypothetical protein
MNIINFIKNTYKIIKVYRVNKISTENKINKRKDKCFISEEARRLHKRSIK